jgi:hypothetical protein
MRKLPMNILTKTAVLAAVTAPLLMATTANAGDCGAGDPGCLDDPSPSLEQVLVQEARRGLRKLDRYLEHRYGDDTPYFPMRSGKRR